MSRYATSPRNHDRCVECGAPIAVEMSGPWSYRVCSRSGHVQPQGPAAGPLAGAIMLYSARGS